MKRTLLASTAAIGLALPTHALAQDTANADGETGNNVIIVTAQRVEQNINDIPIAVSSIGGDDLLAAGVSDPTTLGDVIPNLSIVRNNGGVQITIRGVTSTDLTEKGDPSAAFLVDGIFIARPQAQEVSFLDLERIEVLRGPQGTLYGRNTTAGVINLISARPTDAFEGSFSAAYGNYDTRQVSGMLNIPVTEGFALRAAANYDQRENYVIDQANDGFTLDPFKQNISGRLSALIEPSDNFNIIIRADYSDIGGVPQAILPLQNFFDPAQIAGVAAGDILTVMDGSSDARLTDRFAQVRQSFLDNDTWGVMAEANLDIGAATITYLGSYREFTRDEFTSGIFVAPLQASVLGNAFEGEFEQESHELRLAFGEGGPLFVQTGVYYFKEESGVTATLSDEVLGVLGLPFGATNLLFRQDPVEAESIGVFAQGTFKLTEDLSVTGGIRWSEDKKSRDGNTIIDIPGVGEAPISSNIADVTFDEITWRIGIDYQTGLGLIYGVVSTGYKAGGFNGGCLAGTQPGCTQTEAGLFYDPETVTSYELGAKLELAEGLVGLNLSAFYYDYKNLQVNRIQTLNGAPVQGIGNAAESTVKGIEADAIFNISANTKANLSVTLLDAEYDAYQPLPGVDFSGRSLDRAPKLTLGAGITHTIPLGNGGDIELGARTRYSDSYLVTDQAAAVQFKQSSFTRTSLSATYNSPSGDWYVQGYADNLENEVIVNNASLAFGGSVPATGDPRTYGIRFGLDF